MKIDFPGDGSFRSFGYPGGERQTRFTEAGLEALQIADTVRINARVRNTEETLDLLQLLDAVHSANHKAAVILALPYLPYARADRRFVGGDCNGLKVFANLIQSSGVLSHIVTLDVHNYKAAYDFFGGKLVDVRPTYLIMDCIELFRAATGLEKVTLLFPDVGALERYGVIANRRKLHGTKVRDAASGKLLHFDCDFTFDKDEAVLVVDDICDGGGTFLGVAEALEKSGFTGQLGLYVTHGIFSKGTDELLKHYKKIYCTDSFSGPYRSNGVEYFPAWKYLP